MTMAIVANSLTNPPTTILETNKLHLKMDGWNTNFLLGWPIFKAKSISSGECANQPI